MSNGGGAGRCRRRASATSCETCTAGGDSRTDIKLKQYLNTKQDVSFENRRRFYQLVLTVMRHVLMDGVKKGGKAKPRTSHLLTVGHAEAQGDDARSVDTYDFYRALDRLRARNKKQASAIELHYMVGWPLDECAEMLDISTATLKRQLVSARQWFDVQLRGSSDRV
jgi:DNA-directed RNA polymerase specialized sigma24 family protein